MKGFWVHFVMKNISSRKTYKVKISYFQNSYTLFKRYLSIFLILVSLILGFNFCKNIQLEPIKIGTNSWIGYEPFYLARHLNFIDNKSISIFEMPSASDVIRAFRNGLLDCATLTLDESYLLLQDSMDIKILFIIDISLGADAILSKPEIKTLEDLKGKKIAVENSAVGAYLLTRAMEFANLKSSDIQIIIKTIAGHEQAYKSGEVDAVVTFEPAKTKILEAGANILFSSKQIPDEIFDVLIIKEDLLLKRRNELENLKTAWYRSLKYIKDHPKEALKFSGKRMGLTQIQIENSFLGIKIPDKDENQKILRDNFYVSAFRIRDIMLNKNLLQKNINPDNLIIK